MDLTLRTQPFSIEKQDWLGSAHGTDATDPITLDGALMGAVFTDGVCPSGVVLGKVTATGRYGPYSAGASDGRQTASGILYTSVALRNVLLGDTGTDLHNVGAALLWHGEVVQSKLPTNNGLDAAGITALKNIRFV